MKLPKDRVAFQSFAPISPMGILAARSGDELHSAWIAFGQWLNSTGLSNSGNYWIFEKWRDYNDFAAVPDPRNAVNFAKHLATDIKSIKIPGEPGELDATA